MTPPQPLGRSLVPLAGESLPGFLLRLSFRLNLPPARLAMLTGLTACGRSPHAVLLTAVPETARGAFAHATRLPGDQVTGLGLAAWQDRYPLPGGTPRKGPALPTDKWSLFAPATRYCPECLAGNGSAIQESFGGPWLKTWHLPVVFACPVHQRLLEHRCPECGQAVHASRGSNTLLPRMWLTGLHPAQCRADPAPGAHGRPLPDCCGARLDRAGTRRYASAGLLTLQDKILGLLDPDGPASTVSAGMPTSPSSYFADLRALGLLAYSTWPAPRDLSPSEEIAAAIDQHAASFRQQERSVPPPLDAAVSAGLAHIADTILADTPEEARWQIKPLLPSTTGGAGRTNWARWVTLSAIPCSEGLQAAYKPLLRISDRPDGRPQGQHSALARTHRWGPENIPAHIPEDWYHRHFRTIPGVSQRLARRTAALRLVQIITGGSLAEAAEFLGISSGYGPWNQGGGRIYSVGLGHSAITRRTRQQPDPPSFETGLRNLTRELSDPATPLTDYQRRRRAMETWSIDVDTWTGMAVRRSPRSHPETGGLTRQIASVYVWIHVTSGDPRFAPRPIEESQPTEIREEWQGKWDRVWGLLLRSSKHRGYYTVLRTELDAFARTLAEAIDTTDART